ncbi:Serine protease, subtilisin family [Nitrosomonas eutropha]|uniref:S8 family serine peptidase n=1 Tax=Nitrosomonas eutropha TaxID=916 RepID=UPI000896949E|nr:S8 family serine peptidase [Nitrosomonas eutropha]SDW37871.1 Serine protease, subtilisin family [Nitrosomonas eutropha]
MSNARSVLPFSDRFHHFFSFSILLLLLVAFSGNGYANPGKDIREIARSGSNGKKTIVSPSRWAKGRLLVIPRAGLTAKEFDKAIRPHGVKSKRKLSRLSAHIYELPDGVDEIKVMNKLKKDRRFKAVELDQLVGPAQMVSDPAFNSSWALPKIQAPAAWDIATGDGVTIAILDTGVDNNHPDLAANMVPGWNIYNGNDDASDVHGHGTKVAGSASAAANNGIGSVGVAWNARIMPIRIANPNAYAYFSAMADGIRWAADHGARVANISYEGAAGSLTVQSAANYMRSKGGVVVVSAGNSGGYISYAPSDALIVASATGSSDTRTSWSSYGPAVDVAAPGASIYTTTRGGGYGSVSGTSFSSPIVAATAALMFSANPDLAPADVDQILRTTAVDLGDPGHDVYYGHGRVDAAGAVNMAYAQFNVDNIAPVISITSPTGGTVSGDVLVDVNYSDNKGVVRVELYVNGRKAIEDTQPPFAFAWDTSTLADGSYTLVAYAFDAAGNQGTSAPVKVTVTNTAADTTPPTISITSPTGGTVSGNVSVSVNFSDNIGVARTELHVNGKRAMADTEPGNHFTWNTTTLADGSYTLVAYAFDAAGNQGTSSPVTVNVKNSDNNPQKAPLPQINQFNLKDGQKVGRFENVKVTADMNTREINLKVNGSTIATNKGNILLYRWSTWDSAPRGSTLTVTVEAGNVDGEFVSQTVSVRN